MSTPRRFPTKDADFNTHLGSVVTYLNSEAARLQVAATRLATLTTLKTAWDDLYPKSTNPNTSTKTIRDQKNDTRESIETLLREIYDDIPASVLTPADRNELNLPERDSIPTPRGKMNTVPGVILASRTGRNIDVECRVTGDSTRPSRHPDSDAIEWRCNVAAMERTGTATPFRPVCPAPRGRAGHPAANSCGLPHGHCKQGQIHHPTATGGCREDGRCAVPLDQHHRQLQEQRVEPCGECDGDGVTGRRP
jgi:hypothetical protein